MPSDRTVLIYSTPTCGFCNMAKDFFKEHGIEYTEIDVSADEKQAEEMVKKSGQMGVPQIYIDEKLFVGFDKDGIAKELGIAG